MGFDNTKNEENEKKHQLMMQQGTGVPVKIYSDYDNQTAIGTIRVLVWSQRERFFRALKYGGLCWIVAVACVVVPILHFVLVPGFLLLGPVVFYNIYARESVVLGGEGTCPKYKKFLVIVRSSHHFPMTEVCGACHQSLLLEPRE